MPFETGRLVVARAPEQESFSQQELEFLLRTLKECNFKGQDVELLYNLVIKIQKQYLEKQNQ